MSAHRAHRVRGQSAAVAVFFDHFEPHHFNGVCGLQPLRTDFGAVPDGAAAEQPVGAAQVFQPRLGGLVAAVEDAA